MVGKTKIPLLIIVILASLSLAGITGYFLQQERVKNVNLQAELSNIKTRQKITETKLEESKQAASDLEAQLQEAKTTIETLTDGLNKEKTAKEEILNQVSQLKTELEQQKSLKSDLETKFNQAQKDIEKAQAQLKDLESEKAKLETKIKELESQAKPAESAQAQPAAPEGVELGKIVVNPESQSANIEKPQEKTSAAVLSEGKVIVVNKDYNFAVINLGNKDGINIGDVFSVYHNDKYIGDVNIEKVHDAMSATGSISAQLKEGISEGDKVVKKK